MLYQIARVSSTFFTNIVICEIEHESKELYVPVYCDILIEKKHSKYTIYELEDTCPINTNIKLICLDKPDIRFCDITDGWFYGKIEFDLESTKIEHDCIKINIGYADKTSIENRKYCQELYNNLIKPDEIQWIDTINYIKPVISTNFHNKAESVSKTVVKINQESTAENDVSDSDEDDNEDNVITKSSEEMIKFKIAEMTKRTKILEKTKRFAMTEKTKRIEIISKIFNNADVKKIKFLMELIE